MFEQEQVERRCFSRLLAVVVVVVGPEEQLESGNPVVIKEVSFSGGFLGGLVAIIGHPRTAQHRARKLGERAGVLSSGYGA